MLDDRLNMLYHAVPPCECVADIGTDHGLLPLELLRQRVCARAIACDISAPSLKKAELLGRAKALPLDCRLADGLGALEAGEADCIVIAGMGGILISEILRNGAEKIRSARLVLQPMTAIRELREFLCGNGFRILAEDMVFQAEKRYHAIVAEQGESGEYDCEIGSGLLRHPAFPRYLQQRIAAEQNILNAMGTFRGKEYQTHQTLLKRLEEFVCLPSNKSEH